MCVCVCVRIHIFCIYIYPPTAAPGIHLGIDHPRLGDDLQMICGIMISKWIIIILYGLTMYFRTIMAMELSML